MAARLVTGDLRSLRCSSQPRLHSTPEKRKGTAARRCAPSCNWVTITTGRLELLQVQRRLFLARLCRLLRLQLLLLLLLLFQLHVTLN